MIKLWKYKRTYVFMDGSEVTAQERLYPLWQVKVTDYITRVFVMMNRIWFRINDYKH